MGLIGEYIDGLSDEARDRIVRGDRWIKNHYYHVGARCLVGHAAGLEGKEDLVKNIGPFDAFGVARQFDYMCRRFGKERVVRAIKKRAGWTPPEELTSESVERSEALVPA